MYCIITISSLLRFKNECFDCEFCFVSESRVRVRVSYWYRLKDGGAKSVPRGTVTL